MTDTTPADALATLTAEHRGQHRCNGGWQGATSWPTCPANRAAGVLADALTTERARVHEAAHDNDAVRAVAEGMTGLVLADLAEDDRAGWVLTARYAIESLAAHLDGLVPA